jgi:peptidoglycan/xylan/chitin deacetylase (PgdA/CDA1 family)
VHGPAEPTKPLRGYQGLPSRRYRPRRVNQVAPRGLGDPLADAFSQGMHSLVRVLLPATLLLLAGCATLPAPSARAVDATTRSFASDTDVRALTHSSGAPPPTATAPPGGMESGSTAAAFIAGPKPTAATVIPAGPTPKVPAPTTVALDYLQALQAKQWPVMWQQLHPLARNRWPDEQTFARFLAAKFAPGGVSTIATVGVGDPQPVPAWDDVRFVPHTMPAIRVAATLTLDAKAPYAIPPSDLKDQQPIVLAQDGGQWKVVDGGPADVQGPVLVPGHPASRRLRVPIMMYHHIAPVPKRTPQMGDYDYRLAVDLTVTPEDFAAQMDWLQSHGYQTITLPELMAALYDDYSLPPHPIVLSFDDGYQDNAQYAAPALLQRQMVGIFNIITGLVGGTGGPLQYMTWPEITSLAAQGMSIESHTVLHRDLGILSEAEAQQELVDSRQTLSQHLGQAPQFICYPSGEPFRSGTVAAQQRLLRLVVQDGYVGGLLDPKVAGAIQSSATPDQLTRIRVAGQESLRQFTASIEDLPGP